MALSDWKPDMAGSVPTVKPNDIKRVLGLIASTRPYRTPEGSVGISSELLAECCDPDSNVFAAYIRALLVDVALEKGLLDGWREGDSLRDMVFEVAATCPLAPKPEIGYGLEDFIKGLA